MPETDSGGGAAGRNRVRALILPREHGAWGLLLVPLLTGVAVGVASAHRLWPLLLFTLAALCLFWMRTPVESLLGSGPIVARNAQERRIAFFASIALALVSAACLIGLMWRGQHLKLLYIGSIAAVAFVAQVILRKLGRGVRLAAQLAGAIGLTSTAAAAYYVGAERLDLRGLVLWVANWLFAWNQIHFVQLRIHASRAAAFSDKFARGRLFLLGQALLLAALISASFWRLAPALVGLAFLPVLARGTLWFFRGPEPLDVRKLGWSEMKQGGVFGILLALAFHFS